MSGVQYQKKNKYALQGVTNAHEDLTGELVLLGSMLLVAAMGTYFVYRSLQSKTMIVSLRSIDFIIKEEISSKDQYNRLYNHPVWPQGDSGITIGIGYDLGYHSSKQILEDWSMLSANDLSLLLTAAGKTGAMAQSLLKGNTALRSVNIPYETAVKVFLEKSLPRFARAALKIYPGLDQLKPDAVGAIISMVYNRGTSLEGERRKEMKAIVPLVANKDYSGIAAQIEASMRLWIASVIPGVATRRVKEAVLVRGAVRKYAPEELYALKVA